MSLSVLGPNWATEYLFKAKGPLGPGNPAEELFRAPAMEERRREGVCGGWSGKMRRYINHTLVAPSHPVP